MPNRLLKMQEKQEAPKREMKKNKLQERPKKCQKIPKMGLKRPRKKQKIPKKKQEMPKKLLKPVSTDAPFVLLKVTVELLLYKMMGDAYTESVFDRAVLPIMVALDNKYATFDVVKLPSTTKLLRTSSLS